MQLRSAAVRQNTPAASSGETPQAGGKELRLECVKQKKTLKMVPREQTLQVCFCLNIRKESIIPTQISTGYLLRIGFISFMLEYFENGEFLLYLPDLFPPDFLPS